MTTDRITPTVNNNGTSRDELVQQRRDIYDACHTLLDALSRAVPNGRDYPGKPSACQRDREIHYARVGRVLALSETVMAEAIHIQQEG